MAIPYLTAPSPRPSAGPVPRALSVPRMGANPLPIVVPCHRVIGSTGKLTGFGGGLDTKARLLALEQGKAGAEAQGTLPLDRTG